MKPQLKYREMSDCTFYAAMLTSMDELIKSNYKIAKALKPNQNKLFTEDELMMLYEWASREYYFTKKHNQELQDSIFNKVKELLKEYE